MRIVTVTAVAVAGLQVASAAPYSDHLDALITELQSRSDALSEPIDKTQAKQKKAVDKALATLAKDSTSLATDIKNASKIAKSMMKVFPSDFEVAPVGLANPQPQALVNNLFVILNQAFTDFQGDAQGLLDNLQSTLNGYDDSSCKTKAQGVLDGAQAALDGASGAVDFKSWAKALGSALKSIAKGDAATDDAEDCSSGGGGGGGGGTGTMHARVDGQNFAGAAGGTFLTNTGQLSILGATIQQPTKAINVSFFGVTTNGTYAIGGGTYYQVIGGGQFAWNVTGSVTLVSHDFSSVSNGTAQGTFWFTATDLTGATTVTVTNGTFSTSKVITQSF